MVMVDTIHSDTSDLVITSSLDHENFLVHFLAISLFCCGEANVQLHVFGSVEVLIICSLCTISLHSSTWVVH